MTDVEVRAAVAGLWQAIEAREHAPDADAKVRADFHVQQCVEHYVAVITARHLHDVERAFRASFHQIDDALNKIADSMSKCAAAMDRITNEARIFAMDRSTSEVRP